MEIGEMKDRIAHIIRAKNLTAAEFAVRLGIQPSNVSHLLSGRNNPSLDFVKKLKETFPEYSLDWIVLGIGPMTVSEPLPQPKPSAVVLDPLENESETVSPQEELELVARQEQVSLPPSPTPRGIVLLFDDDTYRFLSPR